MKKIAQILFLFLLTTSSTVFSQHNVMFLFHSLPQEKIIELPGNLNLSYVEQGSPEGTPVIFLHGYTDSWHSFDSVLANLPKSIHSIAISQRGHGNSDRPFSGYSPSDFANDVAAFIKKLGLGPVVIVGHSMGGVVVQRFALDYPELTKGVVIIGSASSLNDFTSLIEFAEIVNQLNDPIEPAFAGEFQKSTITRPINEAFYNVLVGESLKVPAYVWKAVLNEMTKYNFSGELKNIQKPALIVWGDNDIFCKKKQQENLLKLIKGSELMVYEGTGHAVHWEEPQRFSKDLLLFIDKVNSSK